MSGTSFGVFAPNVSHNSEVKCGANGLSKTSSVRMAVTGIFSTLVKAFTKTIIWEMAGLNESDQMSSVTFFMVAGTSLGCDFSGATSLRRGENAHLPA